MSLRNKTTSSLIWTFTEQFGSQAISFIVQIILARILVPADFGLIAMLTVFIAIGNSIVDGGFTSSLIRSKHANQIDFSTIFFMNLAISVLIYITLYFFAPVVANFYNQPLLIPVLRFYCVTIVIKAFAQVQLTRLTKLMNFKLQLLIQLPSLVIGGIFGVYFAYNGFGVWSLVWMYIIQSTVSTLQLWIYSKWRPSLVIDFNKLRYHFNFGYKLTLSALLNTIFKQIYTVVIGKFFSPTILGYYNRAETLRLLPVQNLSNALNKVSFPLFSSIQDEDNKLKHAYQKLMQQVIFWIAPLMIILMVLAEPVFRVLLTDKWLPAAPYFQLMCISGIMYPLHSYNLNILNVKGRSDLFLRLEIIKKGITIIGIASVIQFGIYGLLYFQIFSTFISFYINTYYSGKLINYGLKDQVKDILPIFLVSTCVGIVTWYVVQWLDSAFAFNDWITILFASIQFGLLYLALSHVFKIAALYDFCKLIIRKS